jgi:hypothetical protein
MRDLIQSLMSFSWAMSLFGARQLQNVLAGGRPGTAAGAFQAVTSSAEAQLSASLRGAARMQSAWLDRLLGATAPPPPDTPGAVRLAAPPPPAAPPPQPAVPAARPRRPCHSGRLDARTVVVLGEGLAAGMGDFSLSEETQRTCFPNVLAAQVGAAFAQPLFEAPGLGDVPGFPRLPVRVPAVFQNTALRPFPPAGPFSNLAVSGFRVADALALRPTAPLVHRADARQTMANFILGLPGLLRGDAPLPTQLDCAVRQSPTWAVVALGYYDVLEPAVCGEVRRLPDVEEFRGSYGRLLAALREAGAAALVLTVPDPTDTAYFAAPEAAARALNVPAGQLARDYGLAPDARLTVNGLLEVADQLLDGRRRPLREGDVLGGDAARDVCDRVRALNAALVALAAEQGAVVCDLHGLFRRVREGGVAAGPRRLSGDYFGGFYTLNGYYPGATGHAVIANEVLQCANDAYGADFPPLDLGPVADADPVAQYRAAEGRPSGESAPPPEPEVIVTAAPPAPAPAAAVPAAPSAGGLRLPAGLVQELPLNKSLSYHGDGIRVVHCRDDREAQYGSCAAPLFGGLALFGSHLSGSLRFQFTPPQGGTAHFTMSWGDGLAGDDGVLAAPQFFRLPVRQARVIHWPGTVVSGDVDLETGEVSNLDFRVVYLNSALALLQKGNPNFPKQPIQFPGAYGSAQARFEQRPDGRLDFTFQGSTFIPLGKALQGDPVRWPLPVGASAERPASVPAAGTALHPHLHLSTRGGAGAGGGEELVVPFNTVQELTLFTHNSSFGDKFSLNCPELGGPAQGRSHILGRLQVQFGERFGDSVQVAVSILPPGGLLTPPADLPLRQLFPGRIPDGGVGHDEFLRFPLRSYFLDGVDFLDDPFDLTVGAFDLRTGASLGEVLHRGFIGQNLFFALVRVEPRTPRSTFFFQGPAALERGPGGGRYRFNGVVHIPYPEGFLFPSPDLTTAYRAGPNSALDPFLRLQGMDSVPRPPGGVRGGADMVTASNGNRFSYRYALPGGPAGEPAAFEYVNHSQGATFRMTGLAWESFTHSRAPVGAEGDCDTVTFAGFGTWSKDPTGGLHVATVQVSTAAEAPYVSIQIDGAYVSNVNTKPEVDEATFA